MSETKSELQSSSRSLSIAWAEGKMNESEFPTVVKFDPIADPGDARYFGVFIGFLVVFLGIAGNGVTVWAYARNKSLQTSFNILIANLCLVDLIFSAVVISLILPGYIVGYNIFSESVCSLIGYLYYVSLASSLYNLVAIAVNRYIGIVKSKYYQKLFTGQRLALCIASVWFVPATLYLPVVIGGAIKWTGNTLRCAIGSEIPAAIKWYNLSLDIVFQAIPLVVLIVLYTAIFKKVKQVQQKMKGHRKVSKSNSKPGKLSSATSSLKNKSGNTSDDTGDEFKPSSLLEGLSLKPVNSSSNDQKLDENSLDASKNMDDTEDDEKSTEEALREKLNPSNDESINDTLSLHSQPKQRSSIWGMLLRNRTFNSGNHNTAKASPFLKSADFQVNSDNVTLQQKNKETSLDDKHKGEMRRKKSLSTPNLPMIHFPTLDNVSTDATLNLQQLPTEENHNIKTLENPKRKSANGQLKRSKSVYEKSAKEININKEHDSTGKTKIPWTLRIKRNTKDFDWSLSNGENESHQAGRVRFGTIARKVQERKAKETEKYKKRQRKRRLMRKKYARERQLVYSSFTICIAFALCIMPTALLYLIQEFSHTKAPASANLVVACIAWLHAVVNPMIYGYLNAQYRKEYSKIAASITRKLTCKISTPTAGPYRR